MKSSPISLNVPSAIGWPRLNGGAYYSSDEHFHFFQRWLDRARQQHGHNFELVIDGLPFAGQAWMAHTFRDQVRTWSARSASVYWLDETAVRLRVWPALGLESQEKFATAKVSIPALESRPEDVLHWYRYVCERQRIRPNPDVLTQLVDFRWTDQLLGFREVLRLSEAMGGLSEEALLACELLQTHELACFNHLHTQPVSALFDLLPQFGFRKLKKALELALIAQAWVHCDERLTPTAHFMRLPLTTLKSTFVHHERPIRGFIGLFRAVGEKTYGRTGAQ